MTDTCPIIQVRTADAAATQIYLHRMRAMSTAIRDEQLTRPFPMQVGRPFVKTGDLAGAEIGTAISKLESQIVPLRALGVRTPGQDVLLSGLEAKHRALCREAAEISTGTRSTGRLGRYSYRIPTIEIRTGTETERIETTEIEFDIGDAPPRVQGAHAAIMALYSVGGLEQGPVIAHATRGQLRRNTDIPLIAHQYWGILLGQAELIRLEGERHRAGVVLEAPVATGISDEDRQRIRARYRAA